MTILGSFDVEKKIFQMVAEGNILIVVVNNSIVSIL